MATDYLVRGGGGGGSVPDPLTLNNYLSIGTLTNGLATGAIRLANGASIYFDGNANGRSVPALSVDSGDNILIGNSNGVNGTTSISLTGGSGNFCAVTMGTNQLMYLAAGASDHINLGANAAASGMVRLANNVAIKSRNAANNADVNLCSLDGANQVQFGDSSNAAALVFNSSAGVYIRGSQFNIQNTGGSLNAISFTPTAGGSAFTAVVDTSMTSVKYYQADNTTASATAASTTVQAQNATGATATGGDLIVGPGTGTTANGKLSLTNIITTSSVGAAGAASAMPTPVGYINIKINGSAFRMAYFN